LRSRYTYFDAYNRPVSYLRISVTDRCNLRCIYCMPPGGVPSRSHEEILRYEEIETVARAAAELGISKVRLTGGEPLVRLGIVDLVRMLACIPGVDDLSMTTNGILLSRYAADLAEAGLRRANVSLDTLRLERFRRITRLGRLEDVMAGMEAALGALEPVQVSTGGGPARYYHLPGAEGTVGLITPISEHFCYQCNRLRLTSDGQLRSCLLSDRESDLRTPLRRGAGVVQIKMLLQEGINSKPLRHHLNECHSAEKRVMSEIGG
jgi:cyclic pyranopterin phosphate synthase